MVNLIGQTLGQYRIIEQIGQGGMATVYKAYQPSLDRYVAVKILPPYFAHEPGFAMRFTREARAVARLNHPNILPIYDFGQQDDLSYIVMKYVEAGTLKYMMGEPLALDVTADIIRQIASALDHAHQRGILHRDVKPSNVLMDEGRWVLLTDFGLAKMVEGSVALTASGVGVGTPAYMAPEQGQGEPVGARADIYSLGVVLYEMLTGRVPFEAETPMAVVIKHITEPLPLPRSINPQLPDAVERIILKALAKNPDDRFASTIEMANALAAAVAPAAEPAPEIAEMLLAEPLPPPPIPLPTPTPPPLEPRPTPTPPSLPEEPTPVPTPTPPPAAVPALPGKGGPPWKILGAVAGVVLLALVAIFVVSNLGGDGAEKATPPVAAAVTREAATATRPAPTATPRREPTATRRPTPTRRPPRPGEELREVEFEAVYLKADFERPFEFEGVPEGWMIGDDGSGNHVLIGKGPNPPFLLPHGFDWTDYILEARVMLAEGEEGHVLVRWPTGSAKEGGLVLVFAQDRWELFQEPGARHIDDFKANNEGVWHRLRVVVLENRLAAFLDGDLMFDAEIEVLAGTVGLVVVEDSVIFVDDLRITGPPLPPQRAELELYDDFDRGLLDEVRWEWRPATDGDVAEIDDGGALVIVAENPDQEPRHGELVARIDRPVAEVQADLTVEHLEGEHTDLVINLFAEGQRMAGIMGETGNVTAFEEEGGLRILLEGEGLPARYHLRLVLIPEEAMIVIVDGNEVGAIPAPPVADGFSIGYRVDPNGSLVGQVDNVEVRYFEEAAMPGEAGVYRCEDELGCVEIPPGEPIHIAYMLDTSGLTQSIGIDSLRGIEIAVDRRREILGHPIELTGEDSGCNLEVSREAASRLAADPAIVAVVGPTCSTAAGAAAPIISRAGLVMVSPSNTRPLLTDPRVHQPGYLRVAPNDKVQGSVAAEFAMSDVLNVKTAATLYEDNAYSETLQQLFAEAFRELGGEITVQEKIVPDDADDVRRALELVAQTQPEFVFYPLSVEVGGLVTRLARETAGLEETILMGADGMFAPELLEVAGPSVVGLYLSSPDLLALTDAYRGFREQYEERYNERPQALFHAHAYDATMMILAAIERVAVLDDKGGLHIGRQALREALFATRDFEGLTGVLTCTPHGDCAEARVSVYQVVSADPDSWNPPGDNPRKVWP